MKTEYRIYMETTRTGDGGFSPFATLEGGWYGHVPLVGMNEYIYCRTPDKDKAWTYTADECARTIEEIRNKGYPCHAVPPLTITRTY